MTYANSRTTYEWTLEYIDEHGDIIDADFDTKLADLIKGQRYKEGEDFGGEVVRRIDIGLVRDYGNDEDGLIDRQHAYIKDGAFPVKFDGGAAVPTRFALEMLREYQK